MITCVAPGEYELDVKRSRFIAISYRIESRDDVGPIIAELKNKHIGARHVCYAFIADEKGDDFGYDDNGEPSGTAGKPIYSALAASGACKTLIAVVRYFGGVKLGAGGLTRAYRESTVGLIDNVGLIRAEYYAEYALCCTGDEYKRFMGSARNICTVERIEYAEKVKCLVTVSIEKENELLRAASIAKVSPERVGVRCLTVQ